MPIEELLTNTSPFTSPTSTSCECPPGDDRDGTFERRRNVQVLCEVVERSERKDAKRNIGSGLQRSGNSPDRPVAAADHDCVDLLLRCVGARPLDGFTNPLAVDEVQLGIDAEFRKCRLECSGNSRRRLVPERRRLSR